MSQNLKDHSSFMWVKILEDLGLIFLNAEKVMSAAKEDMTAISAPNAYSGTTNISGEGDKQRSST